MKTLVRLMIAGAFVLSFSAAGYAQMQATPPAAPASSCRPRRAKGEEGADVRQGQGMFG